MKKTLSRVGFALFAIIIGWVTPSDSTKAQTLQSVTTINSVGPHFAIRSGGVQALLIPQQTNLWCWAASGEMAMQYFGRTVQQCQEAGLQFNTSVCCVQPTPVACIKGGQVIIGDYGFRYQQKGGNQPLSFAEVEQQISQQNEPWIVNPYCASSSTCGSWGHVMVGIGFSEIGPLAFISINDPWPPNTGDHYLETYGDYSSGCWTGNAGCSGYAEGYDLYDIAAPLQILRSRPRPAQPLPLPLGTRVPQNVTSTDLQRLMQGDPDPVRLAASAWKILLGLLTNNIQTLGFASSSEASDARLGPPIGQFDISLSSLRSWNRGTTVESLFQQPTTVLLIPLEIGGGMRASIGLRKDGTLWHLSTIGRPQFTRAWAQAQAAGGQFVLFVEGLEVAFAAKRVNGQLWLSPLFAEPRFHLEVGHAAPADAVLSSLVGPALSYHGNGATLRR